MKSGANYVVLRRLDIDTSQVDKIIFAFKSMSALITKEYPGNDVTEKDKLFSIKLYQEDTIALKGDVSIEAQINFKDGAVGKTAIDSIHISNSLFTEVVEGNNPTGTVADDVTFEVVGDVIIGKIVGEVEPEVIEKAVEDYLDKHPIPTYDDTQIKLDIKDLQDNKQNAITSTNKLDYGLLDNVPTIPTVPKDISAFNNDKGYLTQHQDISGKQNVITDLETIRSGASLGATALQSVPNTYAKKSDIPSVPTKVSQLQNDENFAKVSDIPHPYDDTEIKDEVSQIISSLSEKQDNLVSGTNIKTINGNSILGSGNITIQGGSGGNTPLEYQSNNIMPPNNKLYGKQLNTWTANVTTTTIIANSTKETNYVTALPLEVNEGEIYAFCDRFDIAYSIPTICFFGEDKVILSGTNLTNKKVFTVPPNAKYMMCAFNREYDEMGMMRVYSLTEVPYFKKYGTIDLVEKKKNLPKLVLRFDDFNLEDSRYHLVKEEFGFNFSTNSLLTDECISKLYNNGCDICTYSKINYPPDTYGDSAFSSTDDAIVQAWDDYVLAEKQRAESVGIFNPIAWLCRQGKSCEALENACKKYGYKIVSGDRPNTAISYTDGYRFVFSYLGFDASNPTVINSRIANAINTGRNITILTHKFWDTEEEAIANSGATEEQYRNMLNVIKSYVDNGQLEVVTFRDFYSSYFEQDGYLSDYTRCMKRAEYLANK